MPIQLLSEQTIAQIAAGEVVERPTSVVKELLENAIDAGATHIHIAINAAGRKLIRISDNGSGIVASEVELAFARHATSKLQTINDLERIATLGFRGEALSSIAAVSRVTLTTRTYGDSTGIELKIEGGKKLNQKTVGAPVGTVISVENLFYNTPARLKFLRKENTEKRHVLNLVTRYAMAYPAVRFVLETEGREVFRSHGGGELSDVIVRAFGLDNFKHMAEVFSTESIRHGVNVTVQGYTSTPEFHRSDRGTITLFVNGRWIQDVSLTYAVVQAYHMLLESGRYPVAVLMIDLPSEDVDVNVHPTKAEVRFREENLVFSAVQRAVRQAVIAVARPEFRTDGYHNPTLNNSRRSSDWNSELVSFDQLDLPLQSESEEEERNSQYKNRDDVFSPNDPTSVPYGPDAPLKPRTLPMLRVIGQIGAMYIVAEGPAGMYLIDQNAAHARVLFEQISDLLNAHQPIPRIELTSRMVDLTAIEAKVLEPNLEALRLLGLEIESFGQVSFLVRSIPEMLDHYDAGDLILILAQQLNSTASKGSHEVFETLLSIVAQLGAVKSGQILSIDEMQSIIRQLERCQSPFTSPLGSATLLHMSGEQIAREFSRQ